MSFSLFSNLSSLGLSGAMSMPVSSDAQGTQAPSDRSLNTPKAQAFSAWIEKASGGRDSLNTPSALADSSASQGNSLPVVGRELPRNPAHTTDSRSSSINDSRSQASGAHMEGGRSFERPGSGSVPDVENHVRRFVNDASTQGGQPIRVAEDKSTHVKAAEPSVSDGEVLIDASKVVISDLTKAIHSAIHQAQDDARLYKADSALSEAIRDTRLNAQNTPALETQLISGVAAQVSSDRPQAVVRPRPEANFVAREASVTLPQQYGLTDAKAYDDSIESFAEGRSVTNVMNSEVASNTSSGQLIDADPALTQTQTQTQTQTTPQTKASQDLLSSEDEGQRATLVGAPDRVKSEVQLEITGDEDAGSLRVTQPAETINSEAVFKRPELEISTAPSPSVQQPLAPSAPVQVKVDDQAPSQLERPESQDLDNILGKADAVDLKGYTEQRAEPEPSLLELTDGAPFKPLPNSPMPNIGESVRFSGQLDGLSRPQSDGGISVAERAGSLINPNVVSSVGVDEPVNIRAASASSVAAELLSSHISGEGVLRSEPFGVSASAQTAEPLNESARFPGSSTEAAALRADAPIRGELQVGEASGQASLASNSLSSPSSPAEVAIKAEPVAALPNQTEIRVDSPSVRADAPAQAEFTGLPNDNRPVSQQRDVDQFNKARNIVQPPVSDQMDARQTNSISPGSGGLAIRGETEVTTLPQGRDDAGLREASTTAEPKVHSASHQGVPEESIVSTRETSPKVDLLGKSGGESILTESDAAVLSTDTTAPYSLSAQDEVITPADTNRPEVGVMERVADTPEAAAVSMLLSDKESVQKAEARFDKAVRREDSTAHREGQRPVGTAMETERMMDSMRSRTDASDRRVEMELRESMLANASSVSVSATKSDGASAFSAALNGVQTAVTSNPLVQSAMSDSLRPAERLMDPAWAKGMGERAIMMVQQGPKVAEIRLDPPELGSLRIRIHVHAGDQVNVSFNAPNAAVREVLEQHMPRLREMFAEQGLNLADSSVSDQPSQQQKDKEGGGLAKGGKNIEQLNENNAVLAKPIKIGLVDYYA